MKKYLLISLFLFSPLVVSAGTTAECQSWYGSTFTYNASQDFCVNSQTGKTESAYGPEPQTQGGRDTPTGGSTTGINPSNVDLTKTPDNGATSPSANTGDSGLSGNGSSAGTYDTGIGSGIRPENINNTSNLQPPSNGTPSGSTGSTPTTQTPTQTTGTTGGTPAFCNNGTCTYIPLEPLPGGGGGVQAGTASFASLLAAAFKLLVTLGSLFAVVMLIVSGIAYMLSETPMKMSAAKDRAVAALKGLLIIGAAWLIVYTINPKLLNFNLLTQDLQKSAGKAGVPGFDANAQALLPPPTPQTVNEVIAKCTSGIVRPAPDGTMTCYPNL